MTEPLTSNYPAALDDDGQLGGDQVNIKSFTLGSGISDVDAVIPTTATISGVNVPFYLLADSELIYIESISGSDFDVVVRGAGGTTAASHSAGIPLYVVYAANLFNQLKRAIIAVQTELGVAPSGSESTVADRLDATDSHTDVLGTFLSNTPVPASTTYYSCPLKPIADATPNNIPWPEGGVLSNMTLRIQTHASGGDFVATLIVNGSPTALVITVPTGSPTASYTNNTDTVTIDPGDTIRWDLSNFGSGGNSGVLTSITMLLTKPNT